MFVRWAAYYALASVLIAGWTASGIAAFLAAGEFWRGAWVGGSAVPWVGYVPALVWAVRLGRRQTVAARAADAALVRV